jgi:hypothetical protein
MSDDLRTRIAAVIYGAASQWDDYPWDALAAHVQALYLGQADAVIAELGMREQTGNNAAYPQVIPCAEYLRTHHRYVTDWKADE